MTTTAASSVEAGGSAGRVGRLAQRQRSPSEGTDSGGSRETWTSTNKILNSSLCGRRTNSRNPNFDYDETKLLISLWGDPQVQKTLITTHKKHPVIAELARKMREQGYSRSTEEINTRIKNLKCFYNRIKKDMAAGIINQTTWRHYAEMDEIISRPVFGNAHRLHMMQQQKGQDQQQQQQSHKQQPQEQTSGAKGRKAMTSDEGEDDDEDLPIDQYAVKLEVMSGEDEDDDATEIRAEDLLTIDAKFPEDSVVSSTGGGVGKPAGGKSASNGRGASVTNGRSGKQTDDDEEDDEDDEDDEEDDDEGSDFDVENEFNDGLDEILLKAQKTKGGSGTGTTAAASATTKPAYGLSTATATSKPSNSCGLVIETISSANGTTINAATSSVSGSTPTVPTAGKISVVPTNLLMKQPTTATNMSSTPIQIYTQPTVSLASSSMMSSVSVNKMSTVGKVGPGGTLTTSVVGTPGTTGVTPMKLLLVNTVAKDGTTQQILTPASEVPAMSQLIPAGSNYHQTKITPITLPAKTPIVSIPAVNVAPKELPAKADGTNQPRKTGQSAGFKTLLTQLVTIQRENLAINQERLALEKERLDFEKQFGGSFVSMVRNMSSFFSGMLQHQRKDLKANQQQGPPPEPPQALMVKNPADGKPKDEVDPLAPTGPNGTATEESNDSSIAPSPTPASDPLQTATAGSKRRTSSSASSEATAEKPPSRVPSKDSAEAASPTVAKSPQQTTDNGAPQPGPEVVPLPKKRRMMTRNSSQIAQVPPARLSSTEETLKAEVISDNDER